MSIVNRSLSVDLLKIILACLVVGIHSGFLEDFSTLACYLTAGGLFRIAVPIFFVINGFYFFSVPQERIAIWFKRVLLLYLFWTLFYIGYWFRMETVNLFEIARVIKTLLVGHEHLWYLPAMIGAAATILLVKKLSTPLLLTAALFLFAIGLSIQYLGNYHVFSDSRIDKALNVLWLYRNFLFFAFPFFALGYLLARTEIYKKISTPPLILLALGALFLLLVEVYCDFKFQPAPEGFDIFLLLILACPLVFILALKTEIRGDSKTLALYSTGIYFIHPLFISLITARVDLGGTLLTLVVISLSAAASWLLIKINARVKFIL